MNLRRLSLHADLINEFCAESRFDMSGYMQADFLLWLRVQIDSTERYRGWWPVSNLYASHSAGAFPIFLRAKDPIYRDGILRLLRVENLSELKSSILQKISAESIPKWEFDRISLRRLMDFENLFDGVPD